MQARLKHQQSHDSSSGVVPWSYGGDGPAAQEQRCQNSGGPCLFRSGGDCPEMFLILQEDLQRVPPPSCPRGNKSSRHTSGWGLYTGEVMELTGGPGIGKTQVCLHIAANVSESLKQHVLYIDSTAGFTATRLMQLFQRRTETEEGQMEALQRVQVVRVFDAYKLLDVLHEFRSTVAQEVISASAPVKILVVDSVSSVIYPLLGSRQPDGMALLMHVARELKTLAKELGVAVVVTNPRDSRGASSGQTK
uniref:Uncharacterized protein n=1 Tax=Sphaerodactylus townsendi TaxID=933632 RepID=A0ACB8EDE5_9SAUR